MQILAGPDDAGSSCVPDFVLEGSNADLAIGASGAEVPSTLRTAQLRDNKSSRGPPSQMSNNTYGAANPHAQNHRN